MRSSRFGKGISLCNKTIEFGLIFLVLFTAFSFGAAEVWAYSLMEFIIFGLSVVWILKGFLTNGYGDKFRRNTPHGNRGERQPSTEIYQDYPPKSSSMVPLFIPLILFFLLALIQLLPLPPSLIKSISPHTYELYSLTLEGYDSSYNDVNGLTTDSIPPDHYRSLSINPHASKRILLQIFSFITVFFLVINNFKFDGVNPSGLSYKINKKFGNHQNSPPKNKEEDRNFIPVDRLILVIIVTGFSISLLGILQKLTDTAKIFWVLKMPDHAHPFATFVNRNNFAGYINMIVPLGLAALLSQQSFMEPGQRHGYSMSKQIKKSMILLDPWLRKNGLYLISTIIMVSSLIYSGSRGGIICLALTLIVFYFFTHFGQKRRSRTRMKAFIPIAMGSFILVTAIFWSNPNETIKRFKRFANIKEYLERADRVRVYRASYEMAKDFPILGAGLGAFPNLYFKYRPAELARQRYLAAHCDYLQVLVETGIIGLLAVMSFLLFYSVLILNRHCKEKRDSNRLLSAGMIAAIFSMLLYSFFGFNLQIPANALLFSQILGFAYIIGRA